MTKQGQGKSAKGNCDIEIGPILQEETAIENIAVSTLEGNTAYIENYMGKIETDEQADMYTFQTQVSGRYRIEISGMLSGVKINLEAYNAAGENIGRTIYRRGGDILWNRKWRRTDDTENGCRGEVSGTDITV